MEHRELLSAGVVCYWDDALFRPGTDSFLLGAFARPKRGSRVCDLGAGTGLLGLLLLAREPSLFIAAAEREPQALALARRGFCESGFSDLCAFYPGDLRDRACLPPAGSMDYVLSNPPYFPAGSGREPSGAHRRAARTEANCTLDDVCAAAGYLLRWGGRFALVHRAERLADVLCAMRARGMEPKRLRLVQETAVSPPILLLAEGVRGGKSGLSVQPPLLLRAPDGSESAELRSIYFRRERNT